MGKAQSKRSVDITTESKKGAEEEITEKMEKIEDLDKKEVVNGDATVSEKCDPEKKDTEEVENDKDMTTEKDVDAQASGDSAEHQNTVETSKEEGVSAVAEEISPLADESIKKSKKEKVKKKWSFRSISFGKKDKQKPAKNEDAAEDGSAAINGADTEEKVLTEPEDSQKDQSANKNEEEKTTESHENGNAIPQELGEEENEVMKTSEEKSNEITANMTNNTTTTTEKYEPVQNETATASSELSEKTENIATNIINETKITENATVDDASKNGNGLDKKMNATEQEPQKTDVVSNASDEAPSEKTSTMASTASTNGEVVDKIHQNGDHGEEPQQDAVEKSKAQIEVNSNTDNTVSAVATLDSISSTSINPSNVQIRVQDLNASSEKLDEIIQKTTNDIEADKTHTVAQTSISEVSVNIIKEIVDNIVQVETAPDLTSEAVATEKSSEENKVGDEPSPPPLPISPPPSQVSVFAFTNNDESVEDSMQTKNSEQPITLVEENEEMHLPPIKLAKNECFDSQETNTINNEKIDEEELPNDQNLIIQGDVKVNEMAEIQCDEIKEESICKDTGDVPSTGLFKKSENEEASVVAAAVIDEITERAAEIVTQQLTEEQQHLQSKEERQEINKAKTDETINENCVVELDKDEKKNQQHDKEFHEFEVTSSSKESLPSLGTEQTNKIATECSSDSPASNSIQQDQDELKNFQNKSDDNLDEEHLNPTKEFANAKGNVTVAEITQDLSVTCE